MNLSHKLLKIESDQISWKDERSLQTIYFILVFRFITLNGNLYRNRKFDLNALLLNKFFNYSAILNHKWSFVNIIQLKFCSTWYPTPIRCIFILCTCFVNINKYGYYHITVSQKNNGTCFSCSILVNDYYLWSLISK